MNTPEHLICTCTPTTQTERSYNRKKTALCIKISICISTVRRAYMAKEENGASLSKRERVREIKRENLLV